MPNHVTNRVKIEGPIDRLEHLKHQVCGSDSGSEEVESFCFNSIIPMPEDVERGNMTFEQMKANSNNWYDWSRENWGTKWGAYGHKEVKEEEGVLIYEFDTAWSWPGPVFEKLSKLFPELNITVETFDEGWNFAATLFYRNGELIDEDWLKCKEENDAFCEMCIELKGYDPREDE